MKTISMAGSSALWRGRSDWRGVRALYRLLCDVTASGKKIIEKTLGCGLDLPENWNSGSKDDPHIGAIMLAFEFLIPIGIFALLCGRPHKSVCVAQLIMWSCSPVLQQFVDGSSLCAT